MDVKEHVDIRLGTVRSRLSLLTIDALRARNQSLKISRTDGEKGRINTGIESCGHTGSAVTAAEMTKQGVISTLSEWGGGNCYERSGLTTATGNATMCKNVRHPGRRASCSILYGGDRNASHIGPPSSKTVVIAVVDFTFEVLQERHPAGTGYRTKARRLNLKRARVHWEPATLTELTIR